MMRPIIILFLSLQTTLAIANHLSIVYPHEGQNIAAVESTFIFGNTEPSARLFINGTRVPIHPEGGFLAFLPVHGGNFAFDAISILSGDTTRTIVNIIVGLPPEISMTPIVKSSLNPRGRTSLMGADELEIAVKGKKGGQIYARFKDGDRWIALCPARNIQKEESAFGDLPNPVDTFGFINYEGYLPMAGFKDSSKIYFLYLNPNDSCFGQPDHIGPSDSSDYYVVKYEPTDCRVVTVTGRTHIVRIAPEKGYRLVNQPPGVRFQYAGETPDYFRVRLAGARFAYVKKIDSELSPLNSPRPRGEVASIAVDNFPRYVEISMVIGDQLPFEIFEQENILSVDIYGLTPNVDWIRQNGVEKYIDGIWWSQPEDGVFRLSIRWKGGQFWGYGGRYENGKFILRIRKKPAFSPTRQGTLTGLKIMLDPGHSKDTGAVGPTGLAEKDVNLWIARQLKAVLESKGAKVLMTRTGNEDVPLYNRPDTAIKEDVDLLISVHNNALPDGINPFTNNGTSTYYYFPQARLLADLIHQHMLKATGLPDYGLYYGNLALTRVSECPAVLVECAFMMIPDQEAKLKQSDFRQKIAKAIAEGIGEFVK
jgi:N-acetylmuramoyl-L-alanine amidase